MQSISGKASPIAVITPCRSSSVPWPTHIILRKYEGREKAQKERVETRVGMTMGRQSVTQYTSVGVISIAAAAAWQQQQQHTELNHEART